MKESIPPTCWAVRRHMDTSERVGREAGLGDKYYSIGATGEPYGLFGARAHVGVGLPPNPLSGNAPDCQIAAIVVSCQIARLGRGFLPRFSCRVVGWHVRGQLGNIRNRCLVPPTTACAPLLHRCLNPKTRPHRHFNS